MARQWSVWRLIDLLTQCGYNEQETHQKAVKQFAEFTAAAVAMYHKIGQLLLVESSVPLLAYKFRSLSIAGYEAVYIQIYFFLLFKCLSFIHEL
jgi:hypothetical protein